MLNKLEKFIKNQIDLNGPMDIGQFMSIALAHPKYGYYMKQDPFGREGDFTTAPEISQIFGEILGAWVADLWMQMGCPESFTLLECGPGRGTLMVDMLRGAKNVKGFHEAAQIHLLEISPTLKKIQGEKLFPHRPIWHDSLETLPTGEPLIVLANEFLDALPFRQLQKTAEGWQERVVSYEEENGFVFALRPVGKALISHIPSHLHSAHPDGVFEIAPARINFIRNLAAHLRENSGVALFIDYGPMRSGLGDSFQALKDNAYAKPLEDVGNADLTSHVDFEALAQAAGQEGLQINGPVNQGTFLQNLGIGLRAQKLKRSASKEQGSDIEKSLHRLTDSAQMGKLFKVLCMRCNNGSITQTNPAGF